MASIPPEILAMAKRPGSPEDAPAASPMALPERPAGDEQAATTAVEISRRMLQSSLPAWGVESPQGKSVIRALTALSKIGGKVGEDALVPSEIMQLVQNMPEAGAALRAPNQPQAGGMPAAA